jgi:hypothetical protein
LLDLGGTLADHPELLSSDDEDADRLMQEKFSRQRDSDDEDSDPVKEEKVTRQADLVDELLQG